MLPARYDDDDDDIYIYDSVDIESTAFGDCQFLVDTII